MVDLSLSLAATIIGIRLLLGAAFQTFCWPTRSTTRGLR